MKRVRGTRGRTRRSNLFMAPGTMIALFRCRPSRPARATSSGYWHVRVPAHPCFSIMARAPLFVRIPLGQSTLTRTWAARSSSRSRRLKLRMKAFVDEYTGIEGMG